MLVPSLRPLVPWIRGSLVAGALVAAFASAPARAYTVTPPPPPFAGSQYTFGASLYGESVVPVPGPPGWGAYAVVIWEDSVEQVYIQIEWWNLSSAPTDAHMHFGSAGQVTPPIPGFEDLAFPVDAGRWGFIEFVRPMTAAQYGQTLDFWGQNYLQIDSVGYPNGEIRGQIIPEPVSGALLGLGVAALAWARRRG